MTWNASSRCTYSHIVGIASRCDTFNCTHLMCSYDAATDYENVTATYLITFKSTMHVVT